jgi:hypothetical protein
MNLYGEKVVCLCCGRRALDVPESRRLEIGPVCIQTRGAKELLRVIELTLKKLNKKNHAAYSYHKYCLGKRGYK